MVSELIEVLKKYNTKVKSAVNSGAHIFVKDNTMFLFLSFCMSSPGASVEVLELALETLYLLVTHGCRAELKEALINEVLDSLKNRNDVPEMLMQRASDIAVLVDKDDRMSPCRNQRCTRRISKKLTLHIHGLNKDNRQELLSGAVKVKGVVSAVCDVDHQRCVLMVHEAAEPVDIASVIFRNTGLVAELVSRNSRGQEVFKPLLGKAGDGDTPADDTQGDWPPYQEEEDSPVKDNAVSAVSAIKDKTSSLLTSAKQFFQKSFYW